MSTSAEWSETLTEGDTGPVLFQLLDDGLPFDGTTMTVVVIIKDKNGATVAAVTEAWETAATSIATFTVASGAFTAALSPFTVHWKVTNGSQIVHYPKPALKLHIEKV